MIHLSDSDREIIAKKCRCLGCADCRTVWSEPLKHIGGCFRTKAIDWNDLCEYYLCFECRERQLKDEGVRG